MLAWLFVFYETCGLCWLETNGLTNFRTLFYYNLMNLTIYIVHLEEKFDLIVGALACKLMHGIEKLLK